MISEIQNNKNLAYKNYFAEGENDILLNISPNELLPLVDEMYNNGEISLKDTLAFKKLNLQPFAEASGKSVNSLKLKYFSNAYDNLNMKRNMMKEYQDILTEQINGGDDSENIAFAKNAIDV